jgi:hypothetical protein
MAILGKKFGKSVRKLGGKFDSKVHQLGNKANNVLSKAEKLNNQVITKSGKALRVADKIATTGSKIVGVLNDAGIKEVPVLGSATTLLEKGLDGAHKGIGAAEKYRNAYVEQSQKNLGRAKSVANKLEKHNTRKVLAEMAREDSESFV